MLKENLKVSLMKPDNGSVASVQIYSSDLFLIKAVSEELSIPPATLRTWARLGKITARKEGRDWHVSPESATTYRKAHFRRGWVKGRARLEHVQKTRVNGKSA